MVGDSETELFWTTFLRHLRERGLTGVRLVIGDHHSGLVKAIRKVMLGSGYQRCRVHFLRNVFAVISKEAAEMVAAIIRTIFAQPTADAVRTQLETVADMLGPQFPKVKAMLLEAKDDLTAFAGFPERRWKKIQSTNPLERLNREIKRRTDVVQVFPNDDALLRLVTAVLFELHDEWIAFPRRYLPEGSMDQLPRRALPKRPRTPQHHHQVIGYTTRKDTIMTEAEQHDSALARITNALFCSRLTSDFDPGRRATGCRNPRHTRRTRWLGRLHARRRPGPHRRRDRGD